MSAGHLALAIANPNDELPPFYITAALMRYVITALSFLLTSGCSFSHQMLYIFRLAPDVGSKASASRLAEVSPLESCPGVACSVSEVLPIVWFIRNFGDHF